MLVSSRAYMFKECHYCGKPIRKKPQKVNLSQSSKPVYALFHISCLNDMLKKCNAREIKDD